MFLIFCSRKNVYNLTILPEGISLKQKEISIFSKVHKGNNKNVLTFMSFYLLWSPFFSDFTFYKEACFIMFVLSLFSNMLTSEGIFEFICQKLKKHAHFKILSSEISFLSFWQWWVHPSMKFYLGKNV